MTRSLCSTGSFLGDQQRGQDTNFMSSSDEAVSASELSSGFPRRFLLSSLDGMGELPPA
jgi:hypothetical protein